MPNQLKLKLKQAILSNVQAKALSHPQEYIHQLDYDQRERRTASLAQETRATSVPHLTGCVPSAVSINRTQNPERKRERESILKWSGAINKED